MKNHIGTVLKVNQAKYEIEVRTWESVLIPAIQNINTNYKSLVKSDMSPDEIKGLITGRMPEASEKANALLLEELKFTTLSFLHDMAKAELQKKLDAFKQEVKSFWNLKSTREYSATDSYIFDAEDLLIEDDQITVDKERIKKRNSIIIETEDQNELYCKLIAVEKAWDDLRKFVNEKGYQKRGRRPISGGAGLFYEEADQSLTIIPEAINL